MHLKGKSLVSLCSSHDHMLKKQAQIIKKKWNILDLLPTGKLIHSLRMFLHPIEVQLSQVKKEKKKKKKNPHNYLEVFCIFTTDAAEMRWRRPARGARATTCEGCISHSGRRWLDMWGTTSAAAALRIYVSSSLIKLYMLIRESFLNKGTLDDSRTQITNWN